MNHIPEQRNKEIKMRQEHSQRGAAWWELLLVLAGVVVMVIVIPKIMQPRRGGGNEAAAISALRTISCAQEIYNTRYETYATLAQFGDADMIDSVLAQATSPVSARSGYYFKLHTSSVAWCCMAYPGKWGVTGERNFKITDDGIIYMNSVEDSKEFTQALGG